MIKIDHTTLAKDPALGWYEIGGKVHWDKASALMEGTKLGLNHNHLHWNFNDAEFGSFDWTIEPPGDIRDYYWARAREIREKYDYIILNCSGGADSTTVLYSFIQQGLHVDEIFVRHAKTGTNKYASTTKELDASNEFSEYEYAAVPLMNWVKQVSPRTKITVHDFSLDIIDDKKVTWDENFIYWCGDYVTPGCVVRYTHASDKDSLNQFDKGKRIGIIFGTDKPRVALDGNDLYLMFVDRPVHSALPATVNNGYTNTEVELFYWHPNSRAMLAKQCHIIKRWFEMPDNARLRFMLNGKWLLSPQNRTAYEAIVKGIVYPDYNLSTFQCNKPVKTVMQEWDYWMGDFKNTEGYKIFMRGVMHLYKNIDEGFLKIYESGTQPGTNLSGSNWEYRPCVSNKYKIGTLTGSIIKGPLHDI
jgi:hypothetical protein